MCWTRNELRVSTNAVRRRNMLLHTARVKRFGGHANPRLARQNLDLNLTHTADVYSPLHGRRWPITLSLLKIRVRASFVFLPTACRGQSEHICIGYVLQNTSHKEPTCTIANMYHIHPAIIYFAQTSQIVCKKPSFEIAPTALATI